MAFVDTPFTAFSYSVLMPASLITLPNLAMSDLIVAASCCGELPSPNNDFRSSLLP